MSQPSLCSAICDLTKTTVVTLGHDVFVGTFDKNGRASEALKFGSEQLIRCLTFFFIDSSVPPLLVLGGDGKLIEAFNISSGPEKRVASYGPHTKKIVAMSCVEKKKAVVFADKFGEVHILEMDGLNWAQSSTFLLQHMSTITCLALTRLPSCHRIVTGDREGHLRVTRYPAVYDIEQFLWAPKSHAPTVILELKGPAVLFLVVGDYGGQVTFWKHTENDEEPFDLVGTFEFDSSVIGLAQLGLGSEGGVAVAINDVCDLFYIPFMTSAMELQLSANPRSIGLQSPVVSLSGSYPQLPVALLRNCALLELNLEQTGGPLLRDLGHNVLSLQLGEMKESISTVDPLCEIRPPAVDPRTRAKQKQEAEESSDEERRGDKRAREEEEAGTS